MKKRIALLFFCCYIILAATTAGAKTTESMKMAVGYTSYIEVKPMDGISYIGKVNKKGKDVITVLDYKAGNDRLEFRSNKVGTARIRFYYTYKNKEYYANKTLIVKVVDSKTRKSKKQIVTKKGESKKVILTDYMIYPNRKDIYRLSLADGKDLPYVKIEKANWKYGEKPPTVTFTKSGTYKLNVKQKTRRHTFKKLIMVKVKDSGLSKAQYQKSKSENVVLEEDTLVVSDTAAIEEVAGSISSGNETAIARWEYWLPNNKQKKVDLSSKHPSTVRKKATLVGYDSNDDMAVAVEVIAGIPVDDLKIKDVTTGKTVSSYSPKINPKKKKNEIDLSKIIVPVAKNSSKSPAIMQLKFTDISTDKSYHELTKTNVLSISTDSDLLKAKRAKATFTAAAKDGSGITKTYECSIVYGKDGRLEKVTLREQVVSTGGGGGGGASGGGGSSGGSSDSDQYKKEAQKYLGDNADILDKTDETVAIEDEEAVATAKAAYEKLSDAAKVIVDGQNKGTELIVALEAAITQQKEAQKYLDDNADILAKTHETIAIGDEEAVATAKTAYEALSDGAKGIVDGQNKGTDLIAALEAAITQQKEAQKYLGDIADILDKTDETVAIGDKEAVAAALKAYEELAEEVKALDNVAKAKEKLDALKKTIDALPAPTNTIVIDISNPSEGEGIQSVTFDSFFNAGNDSGEEA